MKKVKKNDTAILKLKRWVKYKIACGDWQASYEEFLSKIEEFEK